MKTLKSLLANPFLLGAQGFIAGAFLLWSGDVPLQAPVADAPPSTSLVDQARAAS